MFINEHRAAEHQLFRIRFTELNEIYTVMSLRSLAIGMIGIFVPIYLYNIGFSLRQIFLFHLVMFFGEAFFELLTASLIHRIGPKHTIAISLPIMIIHFWLLYSIPIYHWNYLLVALLGSINLALYWQAYHYDFSRSKHKNRAGREVSRLYILLAVLGAIAPVVGGTIATEYGINNLFILILLLLTAATFPLFKNGEKFKVRKFVFKNAFNKKILKDVLSYGGSGMEASSAMIIWPIFVFLIVGSYEKVGIVTSAALTITVVTTYIAGKKADSGNRCRNIRYGSFLNGCMYFFQTAATTIFQVLFLNIIRSLIHSFHAASYTSEYYLHADENSRNEYLYTMETAIDIARVIMFGTLYLLTFVLSSKMVLIAGLLFGACGAFLVGLMPPSACEIVYNNKAIKVQRRLLKAN